MKMYATPGLLSVVFQAKILYTFVVSSVRFTCDCHLVLLPQLPRQQSHLVDGTHSEASHDVE